MKTLIDPNDHATTLAKWDGARAKIWMFHVSHKRFVLMLSRSGAHTAAYVVASGCERISGPFSWESACVRIDKESPNQWGEIASLIADKNAEFQLICSDVSIFEGPAEVPQDPFDGFFFERNHSA